MTPWTAVRQASLSISKSWSLLKLMFIKLVMPPTQLLRPSLSNESGPRVTPGLTCTISWCHCDARAQSQTYHVRHDHWSRLVPMSSLSRNEGKTVFHSFCISLLRFEPQSLVPWKGLAVRKTWTQTPIMKSCCWVIQVRSSKFRGFGVLLVKIETVSSQGPVFKDQVIWNNAHERHVQYIHMVLFSVKRGSSRDFSSTPVVKTSKAGGIDVIPGRGTKTPRA